MGRCNRSGVDVVFVVEDPSLQFDAAIETFRGQGCLGNSPNGYHDFNCRQICVDCCIATIVVVVVVVVVVVFVFVFVFVVVVVVWEV
jgi:hypothetical protein